MDQPFIPIFIKDVFMGGVMQGSPSLAGQLGAVDAVASIIAGLVVSHTMDRFHGRKPGAAAAFVAAFAAVYIGAATRMPEVYGGRFVYMLAAGGMYPLLIMWTSRLIPPAIRGRYFGLTLTARSLGWVAGPFVAGAIYGYVGPREIFYAGAAAWVAVGTLFLLLGLRVPGPGTPAMPEPNSPLAEEGRSG
jgi:MFS family permease